MCKILFILKSKSAPNAEMQTKRFQFCIQSISVINISCIYLIGNVLKLSAHSVCDDDIAALFKFSKVVYHLAAEERAAVLKRGLIDNNVCALALYMLYNTLYGALAEVIRIGFHR